MFGRIEFIFSLCALLFLAELASPSVAEAQREHVVRQGHSLSRVARRYGVRVHDLAAAHGGVLANA